MKPQRYFIYTLDCIVRFLYIFDMITIIYFTSGFYSLTLTNIQIVNWHTHVTWFLAMECAVVIYPFLSFDSTVARFNFLQLLVRIDISKDESTKHFGFVIKDVSIVIFYFDNLLSFESKLLSSYGIDDNIWNLTIAIIIFSVEWIYIQNMRQLQICFISILINLSES